MKEEMIKKVAFSEEFYLSLGSIVTDGYNSYKLSEREKETYLHYAKIHYTAKEEVLSSWTKGFTNFEALKEFSRAVRSKCQELCVA